MTQASSPSSSRSFCRCPPACRNRSTHISEPLPQNNTPEDMAAYVAASFNPVQLEGELGDSRSTFLIAEIEGVAVWIFKAPCR